jgi:hypothetical protein
MPIPALVSSASPEVNYLGGMDPTLGPFDKPLEKAAVLEAVSPLITT